MHGVRRWAALIGVLAGMGRGAAAQGPADGCAALTRSQVSEAVGQAVSEGRYLGPSMTRTCAWFADGMVVELLLQNAAMFERAKEVLGTGERTPATGVGDEAFYLGPATTGGLMVRKGVGAFKVTVYTRRLPPERVREAEMTLARELAAEY